MFGKKALKSNARMLLALAVTVMASAPICTHADDSAPASEGAHRIYSRIEAAADAACGTSNSDIDVIMRGPSPCVRGAIARAVNATKSSNLAQVYVEKNGADVAQEFGVTQDVRTVRN